MFWNKYPYTDFSQINLDWLIRNIGDLLKAKKESGGFLPKFSKSDNDKVLTLKNGAPTWSAGGAGAAALVVNCTEDKTQEDYTVRMNKTWAEIRNAVDAGIPVLIYFDYAGEYGMDYYIYFAPIYNIGAYDGSYSVSVQMEAEGGYMYSVFYCEDENDYPVYSRK